MRISAKAEYACIAMLDLATEYEERLPVHIKTIAENHAIPQGFLVQILLQLKGSGLVSSTRGATGGYQLARSPETISLADIIRVIDPLPLEWPAPLAAQDSTAVQAVRGVWKEIQAEEQRLLEESTLAVLVRRMEETGSPSYQI